MIRNVKKGKWILHDCGKGTCPFCDNTQERVWDYSENGSYSVIIRYCGNCGSFLPEIKKGK